MKPSLRLFAAGASILFWELALIRWLGSNARLVAYFSNFVLTAAFFGLGVGTLASRREGWRLERLAFPLVAASVLLGVALAGTFHYNPGSTTDEFIWIGAPAGVGSGLPDRVIPICSPCAARAGWRRPIWSFTTRCRRPRCAPWRPRRAGSTWASAPAGSRSLKTC